MLENVTSKNFILVETLEGDIPVGIRMITTIQPKDFKNPNEGSYIHLTNYEYSKLLTKETVLQLYDKILRAEMKS